MKQAQEKKLPKVLVGCPTSSHKEYCLEAYAQGLKDLTYKNYDILIVDNSKDNEYMKKIKALGFPVVKSPYSEHAKDRVIAARNVLREKALKDGYDFFLSLEQDVIPPKNIIEGLLSHNKEIITGVVYHLFPTKSNEWIEKPMIGVKSKKQEGKLAMLSKEQIENVNALAGVDYCSMGCLMIHRNVLEKIKFRYEEFDYATDNPDEVKWDDWCFCEDAQKHDFKIHADLGAKCRHLIIGGYSITLGDMSNVKELSGAKTVSLKDLEE